MTVTRQDGGGRPSAQKNTPGDCSSGSKSGRKLVVQPLSEYFKVSDYQGFCKNRGQGIRKFYMVDNCYETYETGFMEKVKRQVVKGRGCRTGRNEWRNTVEENIVEGTNGLDAQIAAVEVESYDDVDGELLTAFSKGDFTLPLELLQGDFEILQRDYLDNPSISHLVIEGCMCSKEDLLKWALQSQEPPRPTEKELRDQSSQTEISLGKRTTSEDAGAGTADYNIEQSQGNIRELQPLINANATSTSCRGQLKTTANSSREAARALILVTPPASTSTGSLPSLLGQFQYSPESNPQQTLQNPRSQLTTVTSTNDGYTKAKNWKPADEKQSTALDQCITDLFQVIAVGRGCRLHSLHSEFERITYDKLDLAKMGIPDVKTLLVQMEEDIILRRERYSGTTYVYVNSASQRFANFRHIRELVAEQRENNIIPGPNSSILVDIDIRELFEPFIPPRLDSTFYGSASQTNPFSWRNPNYQYYYQNVNNQHQTYYQLAYQHQNYGNYWYDYSSNYGGQSQSQYSAGSSSRYNQSSRR